MKKYNRINTSSVATRLAACALAATLSATTASCTNDDDTSGSQEWNPGTIALTEQQQQMAASNATFAVNLFSKVYDEQPARSLVLSPQSMTYALSMAAAGAEGQTREELQRLLGFEGKTADDINQYCQTLMTESAKLDKRVSLHTANILIADNALPVKESYSNTLKTFYQAEAASMDFAQKQKVVDYVNAWSNRHTDGMIPKMIDDLADSEQLILMNAICFKGKWYNKFSKSDTKQQTFTREDQSTTQVDMMEQQESYPYYENETFQMVDLYYGNGSYRMAVLLPKAGKTIRDILNSLTGNASSDLSFQEIVQRTYRANVRLQLPKFTIESQQGYVELLKGMGVQTPFSSAADFSSLTDASVCVDKILQLAKIIVDEQGTEAAAATYVGFEVTSAGEERTTTFTADHPFVYVIHEGSTGTIFFMGAYCGN